MIVCAGNQCKLKFRLQVLRLAAMVMVSVSWFYLKSVYYFAPYYY